MPQPSPWLIGLALAWGVLYLATGVYRLVKA